MTYLFKNPLKVLLAMQQHLVITLVALSLAVAVAVPLGIFLARRPRLVGPVLSVLSILYTIPSVSLLVLLIPLMGLGFWPTIVALVVYCQAILVRNVVVGIRSVDAAVLEAARGMGLSAWQIIWQVELPLALPIILAGVRIAAISTIAIATVAAFFDAGGLGALIREGISQDYSDKIWAGVLAVTLLAILFEQSLRVITRRLHHETADNQRVA
ncbi:MAG: ABC transporter permease [Anaerolineae bacterium]|uniref:ABC transporter permease n=1 Tax=Candidatus Amarolinea dominans TaxID=3140696 RepID=UPI001DB455A2|nr:ABC transporter permease [Anaerolineae bacterium]MBK7200949.1 ABC transporter permease [Anaerolineae bacterium]MBK9091732.1 ABC transporter permease [Anaerolineae bacterium]MBK9231960.1 ABC transporter permease [Anaerolineae bacterium]